MTDITTRLSAMSETMWMDRSQEELDALLLEAKAEIERLSKRCAVLETAPVARRRSEWHEDDGYVTWWKFPVVEPSYIGSPLCDDWPGYHTHWTPHPIIPAQDAKARAKAARAALIPQQKGNADGKTEAL